MSKVSPIVRSLNAGEWSELLDGRTDLDRYPASLRTCLNFVPTPQGPLIGRSGTQFNIPIADESKTSELIGFIFSNEQAYNLEFGDLELRFVSPDGLLVHTAQPITAVANAGGFLRVTSAALVGDGLVNGDQLVLTGFPAATQPPKSVGRVTLVAGNDITLDVVWPAGGITLGSAMGAKVHKIATPYSSAVVPKLSGTQRYDTVYLLCEGFAPRKLVRYGTYDWRLSLVNFIDGPFLDVNDTATLLAPSSTGRTGGGTATASSVDGSNSASNAFDTDRTTMWLTGSSVSDGWIQADFGAGTPRAISGYKMYIGTRAVGTTYTGKDRAPSTWSLQGSNNGSTWVTLHSQQAFILWEGNQTPWFDIKNTVAYRYYRIDVENTLSGTKACEIAIGQIDFRDAVAPTITFTASSAVGINGDTGFQTTDVGRLIRFRDVTGAWHCGKIVSRTSTTVIGVQLQDAPLPDTSQMREWALGLFSDTTGWPVRGLIFQNRFWLTGASGVPQSVPYSATGNFEKFSPTNMLGDVVDDNGGRFDLSMERLSAAKWMHADDRAVLIGTGDAEFSIAPSQKGAITARNVNAVANTSRGSNTARAVKVDRQVLFAQRAGRTLRELTYVYETEGYKCPSMSMFAQHIGNSRFARMVYAPEPHSIVWVMREDGSLVGLTYNREENVIAWHRHDLSGGLVESMSVLPSADGTDDRLWLIVRRVINGQTRRFIEILQPFWSVDDTISDAFYVDSGLHYSGLLTNVLYGLWHLEGRQVYGIGNTIEGWRLIAGVVANGALALPFSVTEATVGLGFDALAKTNRIEAGGDNGTSQGKPKRINEMVARLAMSGGGLIGRSETELRPIAYTDPPEETVNVTLRSKDIRVEWPNGVDTDAFMVLKREASVPLPLNLIALMPELTTYSG